MRLGVVGGAEMGTRHRGGGPEVVSASELSPVTGSPGSAGPSSRHEVV
jgi:hypothetical protein